VLRVGHGGVDHGEADLDGSGRGSAQRSGS